jgi:hypothetical protein
VCTQPGPDRPRGVRPVRQHPSRPLAWPARARPGHADGIHDRGELRRVPALPGRNHDRQSLLPLLTGQVHLGGEPAARAAQPMIAGLGLSATGRFPLRPAIPACARGVLVGPADRGIHADLPADPARRVRRRLQAGQDLIPGPIPLPPAEQPIDRLPRPITGRHIPPRRSRPHPPADPVNQLPAPHRWPATPRRARQHPLQISPLPISQITPAHTKIISAPASPHPTF